MKERNTLAKLQPFSAVLAGVVVLNLLTCKAVVSAEKKAPDAVAKTAVKSPALKPREGYKLVMKVSYFGRVEWFVSPDGARLTSPMLSLTCRPPDYSTCLFNTETKKMKKFSNNGGFQRISMMMQGGMASKSKYKYSPWKKIGDEVVAGRKCTKYTRHMLNAQQDAQHYAVWEEEYWLTPTFDMPNMDKLMRPLEELTRSEYDLGKGFGMRRVATWKVFRRGDPRPKVNDRMVHIDTLECKKTLVDPKIFEFGKNYTAVADEGEILFSDEGGLPSSINVPGGFGRF